jgi:hypothetical protein
MTPRFQRGKTGAISPFFAFQDIITSAMAVLIAIIMLLALYMGGSALRETGERETPAMAARLKSAIDRLAAVQEEIRTARESTNAEEADPTLIQGQIQILRNELNSVRQQTKAARNEAMDLREKDETREMRSELASQRSKNAKAAAELKKIETDAALSLQEMERLEADAKSAQATLLAENVKRNQLWVIPDRSASSKEPVLAVISQNEAAFQRFDNPDQQILNGSKVRDGFADALKNYSSLNQYIVFYFKPSGADHFKLLTREARDAGFEIGYDAIDEDMAVNFGTPK